MTRWTKRFYKGIQAVWYRIQWGPLGDQNPAAKLLLSIRQPPEAKILVFFKNRVFNMICNFHHYKSNGEIAGQDNIIFSTTHSQKTVVDATVYNCNAKIRHSSLQHFISNTDIDAALCLHGTTSGKWVSANKFSQDNILKHKEASYFLSKSR
jgi:hypothetical protein